MEAGGCGALRARREERPDQSEECDQHAVHSLEGGLVEARAQLVGREAIGTHARRLTRAWANAFARASSERGEAELQIEDVEQVELSNV